MSFSQCELSPEQLAAIYASAIISSRGGPGCSAFTPPNSIIGEATANPDPDTWYVRTNDTGRYRKFKWRPVVARVVPAAANQKEMFDRAMAAMRRVAVTASLLLSPYERFESKHSHAVVLVVDAPIALMKSFLESQRRMDDWELAGSGEPGVVDAELDAREREEHKQEKAKWNEDAFKQFSGALITYRQLDLPNMVMYSLVDDAFFVAVFRDEAQWNADPAALSFTAWPIHAHDTNFDGPNVTCENPACDVSVPLPANSPLLETYGRHVGPTEFRRRAEHKAAMLKLWREEYEPLIDPVTKNFAEIEQRMLAEREAEVRERIWRDEESTLSLSLCSRCRVVSYHSKECQKADWARHKVMCMHKSKTTSYM